MYEFLEAERAGYTIRLRANRVFQDRLGYSLKRRVGPPPHEVRCSFRQLQLRGAELEQEGASRPRSSGIRASCAHASASSSPTGAAWWPSTTSAAPASTSSSKERAQSYGRGCQAGPLLPMPSVSSFTCAGIQLGHLSCGRWRCPKPAEPSSLTSLREMLVKIGAKVVSHGRYVTFQMAEVAMSRRMFQEVLTLIARLQTPPRQPEVQKTDRRAKRRKRCAQMGAERFSASAQSKWRFPPSFMAQESGSVLSRMPDGVIMTSQLHHIVGGSLCACATARDESLAKD
jgi:hypothetical protein